MRLISSSVWSDPNSSANSFSALADPTLVLTIGETYFFRRTSGSHPFIIMDSSAVAFISGTDGAYSRTTNDSTLISAATLTPIANFTADPSPSADLISWTPDALGDFWYSCSCPLRRSGFCSALGIVCELSAEWPLFAPRQSNYKAKKVSEAFQTWTRIKR